MFIDKVFSKRLDLIELKDISFKNQLNPVDLIIKNNSFTCLGGKEDSGNSVLLQILMGFKNPTKGTVSFKKSPMFATFSLKHLYKNFGYVNEDNTLYPHLTLIENLHYFGKLYGLKKNIVDKNAKKILNLTGLSGKENELIKDLTHMNIKKANIACSLVMNPKILILDHFTSELDYLSRREIFTLLKKLNKNGMTVIMADSDYVPFENYYDHLIIFEKGKISFDSEKSDGSNLMYKVTIRTDPGYYDNFVEALVNHSKISSVQKSDSGLVLSLTKDSNILAPLAKVLKEYEETLTNFRYEKVEIR